MQKNTVGGPRIDLPQGTLDALILRRIAPCYHHGWAILQ
jgi:hypothetical protein